MLSLIPYYNNPLISTSYILLKLIYIVCVIFLDKIPAKVS